MEVREDSVCQELSSKERQDDVSSCVLRSPCRDKSWELSCRAGPEFISALNEWCQSCLPEASVSWEFSRSDATAPTSATLQPTKHLGEGPTSLVATTTPSTSSSNFKGQLNELLIRILRRPVAPGEVVYLAEQSGDKAFIVTVHVTAAVHGNITSSKPTLQFTGVEAMIKKHAEHNAAAVAVEELMSLQPLEAPPTIKGALQEQDLTNLPKCSSQQQNFKGQLVEALQHFLGRTLVKGDVVYKVSSSVPPFAASVDLSMAFQNMPSIMTPAIFHGSELPSVKEAEQSAAESAIKSLRTLLQGISVAKADQPQGTMLAMVAVSHKGKDGVRCETEGVMHHEQIARSPNNPQFHCKVDVSWKDKLHLEVTTPVSFPSKQLAKEAAASLACYRLIIELESALSVARSDKMARKQSSTMTRKIKAALAPCWHGELLEKCPAAGLQCARLRAEKGWTQRELAGRLQPSQRVDVIKRLEADGEMPNGNVIDSINLALGTTLPRSKPGPQKLELGSAAALENRKPSPPTLEEFIVMSKADMHTATQMNFTQCGC